MFEFFHARTDAESEPHPHAIEFAYALAIADPVARELRRDELRKRAAHYGSYLWRNPGIRPDDYGSGGLSCTDREFASSDRALQPDDRVLQS